MTRRLRSQVTITRRVTHSDPLLRQGHINCGTALVNITVNVGRKTHLKKYLPHNRKWQFFPVAKVNRRPKPELVLIDGKPIRGTAGTFHLQWRENGVRRLATSVRNSRRRDRADRRRSTTQGGKFDDDSGCGRFVPRRGKGHERRSHMARLVPDSSKGSAPATLTPKRLATRGTGQAETQRAAEHGSITPYPTKPVALDRCRAFLRFLPLRFESD